MQDTPFKDNILKKLGGTCRVADICGITNSAVSQWGNYIPPHHYRKLLSAGQARKIDICAEDFFDPPEPHKKKRTL